MKRWVANKLVTVLCGPLWAVLPLRVKVWLFLNAD